MYIYSDIYEIKGIPYLYVACQHFDAAQITLLIKVQQTVIYKQSITKEDLDMHGVWVKPWNEFKKYPIETLWFYYQIQDAEYYLQKMKYCERKIINEQKIAYPIIRRNILEFKELIETIGEQYE